MNIEQRVAARIRGLRCGKRMTQTDLAKRAGLATESISRIETGQRAASLASLEWIAVALDTTPAALIEDVPREMTPEMLRLTSMLASLRHEDRQLAMRLVETMVEHTGAA